MGSPVCTQQSAHAERRKEEAPERRTSARSSSFLRFFALPFSTLVISLSVAAPSAAPSAPSSTGSPVSSSLALSWSNLRFLVVDGEEEATRAGEERALDATFAVALGVPLAML